MANPSTNLKTNTFSANLHYVPFYLSRPVRVVNSWQRSTFAPDLVAGITVALVALPQAIAFALIAGLPVEMGLYATVVAAVVGALWGSTNQIQTGPANAISILVLSVGSAIAVPGSAEYIVVAGMLAVMAGVLQLGIGLTRLGMLVNFVSYSVIVGFASGAAVLIAVNQIPTLLGLQFSSSGLLDTLKNIFIHIPDAHWVTTILGLGSIALLLLLRKLNPKLPGALITMVVGSAIVYFFGLTLYGVAVIGRLPTGFPPLVKLPIFNLRLIAQLSNGALAIAAIGLIQTTAIARAISNQTGQRVDSNQEFVGQGMANIAVGFFSGYAGAASFARSALSLEAGAKTALASIFAGLSVLVAMLAIGPLAVYMPRTTLAAVLIIIAYGLIDLPEIIRILQGTRGDAVIMLVTFFGTLFLSLEFAVLAGILFSFAIYALRTSLPRVYSVLPDKNYIHLVEQTLDMPSCPQLGIIKISGDLYFGAVNTIEAALNNYLADHPRQRFLLLRMQGVNNCDMEGIDLLRKIRNSCRERGGDLFLMKVQGSVYPTMEATGFVDDLGRDHFLEEDSALSYLFYKRLDPAICIYECEARAFLECQNLPKFSISPSFPVAPDNLLESIAEISPQELWRRLHNRDCPFVILDVREPREYQRGHIPQAQLKPLRLLLTGEPIQLPLDSHIVLVCRSGRRSRRAAQELLQQKYKHVIILQGGMLAWENAGLLEAIDLGPN